MEQFFIILEQQDQKDYVSLCLELYPYRGKCLVHTGRLQEYREYTHKYFETYNYFVQNHKELAIRVLELRGQLKNIEEEKEYIDVDNRKLRSVVRFDTMTNLANRSFYDEYYAGKFEESFNEQKILGVEMLDIDCFKRYNDAKGHLQGDICIEAVGSVLREITNEHVFCARYGGDEFVIIYSDMSVEEIEHTVQKIQTGVQNLQMEHPDSLCAGIVTVTQGIFARIPSECNREWDFSSMADKVLYCAKRKGRNQYLIKTEF